MHYFKKFKERVKLALVKVEDAINKRKHELIGWRQKVFLFYHSPQVKLALCVVFVAHMLFAIFERPSYRIQSWEFSKAEKPLLGIELGFISLYTLIMVCKIFFRRKRKAKVSLALQFLIAGIMYLDVIIALSGFVTVRFSRFFRPILFVWELPKLKKAAINALETMLSLMFKLTTFMLAGLLFSLWGVYLFKDRFQAESKFQNFDTFGYSLLQYYSAFTNEIYPDLMYPAVKISKYLVAYFLMVFVTMFVLFCTFVSTLLEDFK